MKRLVRTPVARTIHTTMLINNRPKNYFYVTDSGTCDWIHMCEFISLNVGFGRAGGVFRAQVYDLKWSMILASYDTVVGKSGLFKNGIIFLHATDYQLLATHITTCIAFSMLGQYRFPSLTYLKSLKNKHSIKKRPRITTPWAFVFTIISSTLPKTNYSLRYRPFKKTTENIKNKSNYLIWLFLFLYTVHEVFSSVLPRKNCQIYHQYKIMKIFSTSLEITCNK